MTTENGPILVSIVVRCFNYGHFLSDTLDSVCAQTYRPIELIVVDDGSTDDSAEIAHGYAPFCRVVSQANQGEIGALHTGFAQATGKIILFLDADDVLAPGAAGAIVDAWRPEVARVAYSLHVMLGCGRLLRATIPKLRTLHLSIEEQFAAYGGALTPAQSASAYSAWALRRVLPIPSDWATGADLYVNSLASTLGPTAEIPGALGGYRIHRANMHTGFFVEPAKRSRLIRMYPALHEAARRFVGEERWAGFRPALPPIHWCLRLISHCEDPGRHPYPADTLLPLVRGCLASIRRQRNSGAARKMALAAGVFIVAATPRPLLRWVLPRLLWISSASRLPYVYLNPRRFFSGSKPDPRNWRAVYGVPRQRPRMAAHN